MSIYKDRIASIEQEMLQLQNRKKEYLQKEKAAERKARNHRICKRGAYLECVLPTIKVFSDEQFEAFIKRTLLTVFATRELGKIKPQNLTPEAAESENVINHIADTPATNSTETAKTVTTEAKGNGKSAGEGWLDHPSF